MAISSYATPGVYIEELSTLPPSISDIGTAIPAFIGYTANHKATGVMEIQEVSSLRDYEARFGQAPATEWKVRYTSVNDEAIFTLHDAGATGKSKPVERFSQPKCLLWYAIDHYFRNGGSRCYVVSVGNTSENPKKDSFVNGLKTLESYDEPTLIIIPEAIRLPGSDYGEVCQAALNHAAKMQDRFVILDVFDGDANNSVISTRLAELRGLLGNNNLDRGAAYFPFLNTSLSHLTTDDTIKVEGLPTPTAGSSGGATTKEVSLKALEDSHTSYYNQIRQLLSEQRVVLPPSAAIAGVYASIDRDRGVWKAPANAGLQSVVSPVIYLTDEQQAAFNVDPTTGKSLNAIRSFSGKGTIVWGARTLAGNDNQWRYISVRRLFISVEESIKKATSFAVFEANDASTWLKVKGMIDSYLYSLWSRGALQGSKAEDAYFVNVGLGKTMTSDDVLSGRLIVEIGLAVVRPAEFIILRFAHKVAQ
ncbi:MAG: phage tail sheath C-terminal domain-containing protein [Cyanobacteriota bacterium]|nr:phage tail sheath C-terminal domain-containing protein [Cyanobacteriota bacterium]